ncbi:unnamed protein product [Lactuca virosa]|uniref:Zinc finger GRF-type domain-containing protein n=1 Tax=Lactuca virosa TaxID=75947 RepID=A0AAU9NA36_9ASTR|nr:unnamed protein product [Lactuca virosa]
MSASSSRSIKLLRVGNLRDDDLCPPCNCQDAISVERTAWTDDNVARRFWNCKNSLVSIPFVYLHRICYFELEMYTFSLIATLTLTLVFPFNQSAEGPKCKFFMWKDKEMEEGYYKEQLRKMRFELKRKEEFSEVSKVQKKLVKLQQAMEADKQVFETQLMELTKQNRMLKCGIFVMVIVVIAMWLKWT